MAWFLRPLAVSGEEDLRCELSFVGLREKGGDEQQSEVCCREHQDACLGTCGVVEHQP